MKYNPYNIDIKFTNEIFEKQCLNKMSMNDISNILKKHKDVSITSICLENLCSSSDPATIKAIIKKYDTKVTMKCVKNAIAKDWSKNYICYLFLLAYN